LTAATPSCSSPAEARRTLRRSSVAQLEQYWFAIKWCRVEPAWLAWPYGSLESAEQANEIKTVQVQAIC
jgi:hypothetical protein